MQPHANQTGMGSVLIQSAPNVRLDQMKLKAHCLMIELFILFFNVIIPPAEWTDALYILSFKGISES